MVKIRAAIGDRKETAALGANACLRETSVKIEELRERLDGFSGFAGNDKQSMRKVDGALNLQDGRGIGRIQDETTLPRGRGEGERENFGGETRAPHAQHDNVAQTSFLNVARKIPERGRFRAHGIEHADPAEPIGDDAGVFGIVFPEAGLLRPHLLHGLARSKAIRLFLIRVLQVPGRNLLEGQRHGIPLGCLVWSSEITPFYRINRIQQAPRRYAPPSSRKASPAAPRNFPRNAVWLEIGIAHWLC